MKFRLYRFDNEAAWIRRILADGEAAVRAAIARGQGAFHASLAGGNTPDPVYRAMARSPVWAALSEAIAVHLWVGDERAVAEDSPLRNGKMIKEAFADSAALWPAPPLIHLWPQGPRARACAAYERDIKKELGPQPVFDLCVLGMGSDGHTAGLFSAEDIAAEQVEAGNNKEAFSAEKRRLTLLTMAPSAPRRRMTMAASLLLRARNRMVLVRGREKWPILDAVLSEGGFPVDLTAGPGSVFYYLEP